MGGAAVDVGGGGASSEEGGGGCESADGGEKGEDDDEGDEDEGKQPFLHGHDPGAAADRYGQDRGPGSDGHWWFQLLRIPFSIRPMPGLGLELGLGRSKWTLKSSTYEPKYI